MLRKWMVLAGTMVALGVVTAGLSIADDDEGPLHQIMEKVQKTNLAITKGVRTAVTFKKAQKDVAEQAGELAKLAREAKPHNEAVKKAKDVKDGQAQWDRIMDDFAKTSAHLAAVAGKSDATHVQAKEAHTAVKKTCTDCHAVFRIEEE